MVNGLHLRATPGPDEPATEERSLRLEALFREYAPRILDYARHRGMILSEAEDVVSEVFIVLARRLEDTPDEVLPWLYGVARKVLANQARGQRRRLALNHRAEHEAARQGPQEAPDPSARGPHSPLVKGLARLSTDDREALLLVAWDGLGYEEAARSLGCSRDAFAKRLSRARRRLLARMGDIRTYEETRGSAAESEEA